jgi:hypothetical protein
MHGAVVWWNHVVCGQVATCPYTTWFHMLRCHHHPARLDPNRFIPLCSIWHDPQGYPASNCSFWVINSARQGLSSALTRF